MASFPLLLFKNIDFLWRFSRTFLLKRKVLEQGLGQSPNITKSAKMLDIAMRAC